MSWSLHGRIGPGDREKIIIQAQSGYGEINSKKAIKRALEVINDLIDSGMFGNKQTHQFTISANGHANPGAKAEKGWTDDCMTVSVNKGLAKEMILPEDLSDMDEVKIADYREEMSQDEIDKVIHLEKPTEDPSDGVIMKPESPRLGFGGKK